MPAWDNVSLPAPPNIATAGNYSQMLMQGLSQIPQDYYRGQEARYQQQQRNLFQGGLPTDQTGGIDYTAMLKKMLQSGGAPVASSLIPQLLGQQANQQAAKAFGDQPQVNTGPAAPTTPAAGSPSQITGQPQLSATGSDSAGAESVRSLTAGIAGGREVPDATIGNYARAIGVDPDTPLSADQEARARKIIGNNLGGGAQPMGSASTGGISSPAVTRANPVPQAGIGEDEGNVNQQTPVGSSGGVGPISPAPTSASGAIAGTPQQQPFGERFNAAYGPPTTKDIELHETRGNNLLKAASTIYGLSPEARTGYRDAGNKELEIAKQMREERAKYFEPTSEQKNVATGTERAKGQIAADTKYYDSLHRGLAGSGMIAAQQKQNIDILRQVAAAPSFTPGAGSDLALAYQRIAAQFGINPAGAAPREIFNQVAARILADQFSGIKSLASETGEQGGRIFKPMLDIEEKANITPQDSLEGIKAKLDLLDKTGDLMMRWADKADDYKLKRGQLDAGFDKDLRADIGKARVSGAVPAKTLPGAPPVGHVEAGYRFKGGDHRDAKNWEPAR